MEVERQRENHQKGIYFSPLSRPRSFLGWKWSRDFVWATGKACSTKLFPSLLSLSLSLSLPPPPPPPPVLSLTGSTKQIHTKENCKSTNLHEKPPCLSFFEKPHLSFFEFFRFFFFEAWLDPDTHATNPQIMTSLLEYIPIMS